MTQPEIITMTKFKYNKSLDHLCPIVKDVICGNNPDFESSTCNGKHSSSILIHFLFMINWLL